MKKAISFCLAMFLVLGMILPVNASTQVFSDVSTGSWYAPYVQYVYENGLMNGTSESVFSPEDNMTRAMVVTVLYRIAGEPSVSGINPFVDVENGSWYTNPIIWASETGITTGINATEFGPANDVTREQLVSFIYRYCNYYHGTGIIVGELDEFSDYETISSYAKNAVHWAVEIGVITGVTDTTLEPQGEATRAQCAAILKRYSVWEKAISNDAETIVPGHPEESIPESNPEGNTYILNTNTLKFHYPECRSVDKIKPENYQEYIGYRDDLINNGYSPCGNCDP